MEKIEGKIVKRIMELEWENVVKRPGFLQSKTIIIEAETQLVTIAKGITIKCGNQLWVKESNLYEAGMWKGLPKKFDRAFRIDKNWPNKIFKKFTNYTKLKDKFIEDANNVSKMSINDKRRLFAKYVNLLKEIQKYYIIAQPLTNYCEVKIKEYDPALLSFAIPYQKLDVDKMVESLREIKKEKDDKRKGQLIEKHLKKYAWIKTAYNIIDEYTKKDVLAELKLIKNSNQKTPKLGKEDKKLLYLIDGLQIGIYLRNRMKEMSQQIWYYFDGLGKSIADDMDISRDDFLQMLPQEVLVSIGGKKCIISKDTIRSRREGFVVGKINNKLILITEKNAKKIYEFANPKEIYEMREIKGNIACKGKVKGRVKIVLNKSEFNKVKRGDILVTYMTTPDYVVIMKLAKAIITDEGGLSCHAAIVARELEIPCIIGARIATRVLKDGDLVEVDADNGVVKILKRK